MKPKIDNRAETQRQLKAKIKDLKEQIRILKHSINVYKEGL